MFENTPNGTKVLIAIRELEGLLDEVRFAQEEKKMNLIRGSSACSSSTD